LLPQAIAQDMPTNTSFESAEPLEFENERLLVPSFHLANELWWSWKAPRHGLFTVTAPFAQVTVLTADQMVAGDGQPLSFAVGEDITYFIRAVANSQIEVTLRFDSPRNDRFSDAIELQESDTIKATIRGSTR